MRAVITHLRVSFALVVVLSCFASATTTYDVVADCGAKGDGVTSDVQAIRYCVSKAGATPGGATVRFPAGNYLTGRISLESNVRLWLDRDATLLGSLDVNDYSATNHDAWALIHAYQVSNVSLEGDGAVDGRAALWVDHWDEPELQLVPWNNSTNTIWSGYGGCTGSNCRPRLAWFIQCDNITIKGITLRNSAFWTLHILGSSNIYISGIHILGDDRFPNNDAFDPDSSHNIVFENNYLDTGDDGVCPKATSGYGQTYNMHVRNCTIRSRSCAVKFGSVNAEDMHDMVFENLTIWDTNRGLGIQQRDPGNIYNITFRNIKIYGTRYWPDTWWGVAEPIYVVSAQRNEGYPTAGISHDITFEDIEAVAENGIIISGRIANGGQSPRNITLRNIKLHIDRYSNISSPSHDYRPSSDPEVVVCDIDGIYLESAQEVTLDNVKITYGTPTQDFYGVCLGGYNSTYKLINFDCTDPVKPKKREEEVDK
ncbi:polygalacturonase ADPG1 [Pelomyxa schiedti]|nr:polygalacturonase ADPG1 [Pelomyxa schiedti]